jgi:hypothetical protein
MDRQVEKQVEKLEEVVDLRSKLRSDRSFVKRSDHDSLKVTFESKY